MFARLKKPINVSTIVESHEQEPGSPTLGITSSQVEMQYQAIIQTSGRFCLCIFCL